MALLGEIEDDLLAQGERVLDIAVIYLGKIMFCSKPVEINNEMPFFNHCIVEDRHQVLHEIVFSEDSFGEQFDVTLIQNMTGYCGGNSSDSWHTVLKEQFADQAAFDSALFDMRGRGIKSQKGESYSMMVRDCSRIN